MVPESFSGSSEEAKDPIIILYVCARVCVVMQGRGNESSAEPRRLLLDRPTAPLLHWCVVSALSTSASDTTRKGQARLLMFWRWFRMFCSVGFTLARAKTPHEGRGEVQSAGQARLACLHVRPLVRAAFFSHHGFL